MMTMRAELKRPTTTTDEWNRPKRSSFEDADSKGFVACRVYFEQRQQRELSIQSDKTARVDVMVVMFPVDLDVRTQDLLGDVMNRRDQVQYDGPFVVKDPIKRRNHIAARLEGHNVGS